MDYGFDRAVLACAAARRRRSVVGRFDAGINELERLRAVYGRAGGRMGKRSSYHAPGGLLPALTKMVRGVHFRLGENPHPRPFSTFAKSAKAEKGAFDSKNGSKRMLENACSAPKTADFADFGAEDRGGEGFSQSSPQTEMHLGSRPRYNRAQERAAVDGLVLDAQGPNVRVPL